MRAIIALVIAFTPACGRQNRACILAMEADGKHDDATCESISLGELTDVAILHTDGGKKWCHDSPSVNPEKDGGPLHCLIMVPGAKEKAAEDAARVAAEAKAKIETEAKVRVEAEAKARADLEAKSHVDAGVKPDAKVP